MRKKYKQDCQQQKQFQKIIGNQLQIFLNNKSNYNILAQYFQVILKIGGKYKELAINHKEQVQLMSKLFNHQMQLDGSKNKIFENRPQQNEIMNIYFANMLMNEVNWQKYDGFDQIIIVCNKKSIEYLLIINVTQVRISKIVHEINQISEKERGKFKKEWQVQKQERQIRVQLYLLRIQIEF
ncbi:unnamed protein product [Paramecium sonneborni]|uniref:Uncharacterized protein n=1 Tax=Paramecium sonneborni TaxID=65129 RepID=A0A8S1R980_9CILI|nr:unnamed protein product [Paramecium sonneborni]